MSQTKTCGDCKKYLTYDCPKCEYKDMELNRAASPLPSAPASECSDFEPKHRKGEEKTITIEDIENAYLNDKQVPNYIHPALDYKPELGLCFGVFREASKGEAFVSAKKPFEVFLKGLGVQNDLANRCFVAEVNSIAVNKNYVLQILRLYRELKKSSVLPKQDLKTFADLILREMDTYLYFPKEEMRYVVVSWIVGTYCYVLFQCYPILLPQGPREVGKSTLLTFIQRTAFNTPFKQGQLTAAAMKRFTAWGRSTICFDEAQYLNKSEDFAEMLAMIEAGTEKDSVATMINKETGSLEQFPIYSPKVFATRRDLPFEDKALRITMEEAEDIKYSKNRAYLETDPILNDVVLECILFVLQNQDQIINEYNTLKPDNELHGRSFQYTQPILAISKILFPDQYETVLEYVKQMAKERKTEALTADVEATVLAILIQDPEINSWQLQDLTAKVQVEQPEVKNWRRVQEAIKNLGIIKTKTTTENGVKYYFDIERVQKRAEKRGIGKSTNQNNVEKPSLEHQKLSSLANPLANIKAVKTLEPSYQGVCSFCGQRQTLTTQVQYFNGEWTDACQDCGTQLLEKVKAQSG